MMRRLVGSDTYISVSDFIQFQGKRFVDKECDLSIGLHYVPTPIPMVHKNNIYKSQGSCSHTLTVLYLETVKNLAIGASGYPRI